MTEQLQDMKARLEAATPGPWGAGRGVTSDGSEFVTTRAQKAAFLALSLNDDESTLWLVDNGEVIPAATGDGPRAQANAEFIAHAPEDLAKLIAALEAVEELCVLASTEPNGRRRVKAHFIHPSTIHSAITEALQ